MVKKTCPKCGKDSYSSDTVHETWTCPHCGSEIKTEALDQSSEGGLTMIEGWHFVKEDHYTGEGNILVKPGQKLHVDPPIKLCKRGLHWSRRALDALKYAPGPVACRDQVSGEVLEGDDKAVATDRECLWMVDATQTLHEFACWYAEQALLREREAGREPDPRSWAAIEAKRKWLKGEIDDNQLDAAYIAARDAAKDAALDAARDAAFAAWAAAKVITWGWDTAWAAACAARDAAKDAAQDVAFAAWDTAWDAARDTQNAKLEEMLVQLHEREG